MKRGFELVAVAAVVATVIAGGTGTAQAGSGGPLPIQVASVGKATVSATHPNMTMVQSAGVSQMVHRDTATGRMKLCTPTGKREFLR